MSNCLTYTINEIQHQIPHELLYAALTIDEQPSTINITSLDDKLLRKVIKSRVLQDANVIGGVELTIPLNNIQPSFFEHFYTVYQVPSELTNNREIISVLNLTFLPANGFFGQINSYTNNQSPLGPASFNAINSVANRIGNAASPAGILSNTHLELVAYNTILVYAHYRTIANFGVRVVLENDSNLNNIQPRSYKTFSFLATLATKAYIYNKLIIPINSGYLSGGQELGMFKSILDSYDSAEEEYRTYLREVWGATAYMNDTTRYHRYIGSLISPDI